MPKLIIEKFDIMITKKENSNRISRKQTPPYKQYILKMRKKNTPNILDYVCKRIKDSMFK